MVFDDAGLDGVSDVIPLLQGCNGPERPVVGFMVSGGSRSD